MYTIIYVKVIKSFVVYTDIYVNSEDIKINYLYDIPRMCFFISLQNYEIP